ncbi:hypothetical protein LCGC14_1619370, partial [marine sediment metagenome]
MLRQVYIILNEEIIYHRIYAKGIEPSLLIDVFLNIKRDAFKKFGEESGSYEFFQTRLLFTVEKDLNLLFIFVLGFSTDIENVKSYILEIKQKFLSTYGQEIKENNFTAKNIELDPLFDKLQRNFGAKISIVGLSGVGKTTTTQLIKDEEIPLEHIPTITGKVGTIKLEGINLYLWDFAGQNQFDYLWEKFMAGSDVVLLMTNSTKENVEKSKHFLEISKKVVPFTRLAVIANKQDLPDAMSIEEIEKIMGNKAYGLIAIEPSSRDKIVRIIADLLDMNPNVSPILKPIFERDVNINQGNKALEQGDLREAVNFYEKAISLCFELGDISQGNEYKNKTDKLRT